MKSRIAGKEPNQPNVATKEFRNVAIICGLNSQKDQINLMGCERFAEDTNQKLTTFYSMDYWGKETDITKKSKWGNAYKASGIKHKTNIIESDIQNIIWNLPHSATENFAGKLTLCIGMPVMLRNNDATELCMTKGQEGFVAGWQEEIGTHGKKILDTLFVKLDNPPQNIQFEGLQENIVPIMREKKTIECNFPNDVFDNVEREQLTLLPNFAMTDYASQGKTRPYNVVHLNSCRSHQSYYTALSRSSTAAGTIIIEGFDPNVITKGCNGYLRQEFRELEILNDITKLQFEGELPENIKGVFRNELIHKYQKWKGTLYVPDNTDELLHWSKHDPMDLVPIYKETKWQLIEKEKKLKNPVNNNKKSVTNFVGAKGSKPITINHNVNKDEQVLPGPSIINTTSKKHKLNDVDSPTIFKKQKTIHIIDEKQINKKRKLDTINSTSPINKKIKTKYISKSPMPHGIRWDADNYSCSYDAFFSILYNIWLDNENKWSEIFNSINKTYLALLAIGFTYVKEDKMSLEDARDLVRTSLNEDYPNNFPMGRMGASVGELASTMLKSNRKTAKSHLLCTTCDTTTQLKWDRSLSYKFDTSQQTPSSVKQWISDLETITRKKCAKCGGQMIKQVTYVNAPELIVFEYPDFDITTNHSITLNMQNNETKTLHLKGIVYFGENHFTSRIIARDGTVWFNDGKETGQQCINDGKLKLMNNDDLHSCRDKNLILAVYSVDLK